MKKLLILALVLAPAVASAQSENANVVVSTTIQGAFTLTPTNLAFGNVQEADSVAISTAGAALNAGTGFSRGRVAIAGNTGAVIYTVTGTNLNVTNGNILTIPKSSGTGADIPLVVTLLYGQNNASPASYTPGFATTATNDTAGAADLLIGGHFKSVATTAGNLYSSTINVAVIYN